MTGYAAIEQDTDNAQAAIEIKGYNSRYLDLSIVLPPALVPFENDARRIISERCRRGKIDLSVRLREKRAVPVTLNYAALDTYIALCAETAQRMEGALGTARAVNPFDLLRCEGVLECKRPAAREDLWLWIKPLINEALDRFDSEREREGIHTAAVINGFVQEIEAAHQMIRACLPYVEEHIITSIRKRIKELGIEGIDESRICAETALLLMKWTIAEELSRLEGHFAEFHTTAERTTSPGKKLDFLCQEIGREVNTIGAKTPLPEVSRLVVTMKEALENIREQLRNIE